MDQRDFFFQVRFRPDRCAAGIVLSDDNRVATKTSEWSYDTNVVLTRPAPDDKGNLTVNWRFTGGRKGVALSMWFGWAVPDLDPNTEDPILNHGSFISDIGSLSESGTLGRTMVGTLPMRTVGLPRALVEVVGVHGMICTLSLRYDPHQGTIHARFNGAPYGGFVGDDSEVLCFTDLRNDLVPAVFFCGKDASCEIVVCCKQNYKDFDEL